MKLATNTNTDSLNIQNRRLNCDCPTFSRIKYPCDYGTDNCSPICLDVCCEESDDMPSVSLLFHRACGLLKNHRTHQQLCCLIPKAPVQYQPSSIIAMIVSGELMGDYGFLLCAQRTFCFKPRGIILVEFTQIRRFSR